MADVCFADRKLVGKPQQQRPNQRFLAALTDSEAKTFFDRDGGDQLNVHFDVVAGHAHLNAFGKGDDAGNVGSTEIELRTIVVEERGVTAAFILVQDVNLALELGVGVNGAGLGKNLTAFHFGFSGYREAAHRCCRPPQRNPKSCGTFRYR